MKCLIALQVECIEVTERGLSVFASTFSIIQLRIGVTKSIDKMRSTHLRHLISVSENDFALRFFD